MVRPRLHLEPGIATGAPGPDVLDIDQHGEAGNGYPAFAELERAGLVDGAAAYVRTPAGGMHAYFTGSDQHNGRLPSHHLDFRSQGGYVLAPPSQMWQAVPAHQETRRPRQSGLGHGHRSPGTPAAPATPNPGPGTRPWPSTIYWPAGSPASPKATATPACTGPPTALWMPTPPPT